MDRHDEFALADRFNWAEWKRIFKYVKPYKKYFAFEIREEKKK